MNNTVRAITPEIIEFPHVGLTDRQIDNRIKKLAELEAEAKRIKKEVDAVKAEIKNAMGNAEELITGRYVIKNTSFPRTSVNTALVKERYPITEHPELYSTSSQTKFSYKEV